jgi:hypothetical protein
MGFAALYLAGRTHPTVLTALYLAGRTLPAAPILPILITYLKEWKALQGGLRGSLGRTLLRRNSWTSKI